MTIVVLERDIFGTPTKWGKADLPDILGSDLPDAVVTHARGELDPATMQVLREEGAACLLELGVHFLPRTDNLPLATQAAVGRLKRALRTYTESGDASGVYSPLQQCMGLWEIA